MTAKISFMLLIFISAGFSQEQNELSGSLIFDSIVFNKSPESSSLPMLDKERKSPLLAGVLSGLVPGAGEIYSGSYLKAGAFILAEAALLAVNIVYNGKGDDQTENFKRFADENWSVSDYANWTINHAGEISGNPEFDVTIYSVFNENGSINWNELNRLEGDLGNWYSHRLAPLGDQQYYEMIGKYPQFNMGWNDSGGPQADYSYGDPLSGNFTYYSSERGKANDYYNVASKAVVGIIINHFLSAVDAVLTANSYNNNIDVDLNYKQIPFSSFSDYYPELTVKVSF